MIRWKGIRWSGGGVLGGGGFDGVLEEDKYSFVYVVGLVFSSTFPSRSLS